MFSSNSQPSTTSSDSGLPEQIPGSLDFDLSRDQHIAFIIPESWTESKTETLVFVLFSARYHWWIDQRHHFNSGGCEDRRRCQRLHIWSWQGTGGHCDQASGRGPGFCIWNSPGSERHSHTQWSQVSSWREWISALEPRSKAPPIHSDVFNDVLSALVICCLTSVHVAEMSDVCSKSMWKGGTSRHEERIACDCNPSSPGEVKAEESGVQGHSKFKASLGCTNPALIPPTYRKSGKWFSIHGWLLDWV